jgi:hypothetical protein
MNCLICNAGAERLQTMSDWVELRCADCGHYRVSGTFFAEIKAKNQSFSVEKTRTWLEQQRHIDINDAPMIDTSERDLVMC